MGLAEVSGERSTGRGRTGAGEAGRGGYWDNCVSAAAAQI